MEIMPVETKKRIHEFSYAQKVSNQISPDKSHIKLNESLFKAQILEKQSCTFIKDIQKDLLMKIQKYDSLLKKSSTFQNISISQPNSPPLKQNQEVTQQQNQIKPKGEKLLTDFVQQTCLNNLHQESLPVNKLDKKLSNFTKEKALFSSNRISPIKQEQNISIVYFRRNNTQNTTPKQKSSATEFFGKSNSKLHASRSTSGNKNNLFESKNQVQSSKETKSKKKYDNQKAQSNINKWIEIKDSTLVRTKKNPNADNKNRIKKNVNQRLSLNLCVNTDVKDVIHIISDLDFLNNQFKKKY